MEKAQYFFEKVCDANIEINNKPFDIVLTTDDILEIVKKGVTKALESWLVRCVSVDGVALHKDNISIDELKRGVWLQTKTLAVLASWDDILFVTFRKAVLSTSLWCKVDEEHQPEEPKDGTTYGMLNMEKYTSEEASHTLSLIAQTSLERNTEMNWQV